MLCLSGFELYSRWVPLTESQHIDICKPINLLNKKWRDKNPPQTTQLNKKMKKKKKQEIP